MSSESIQIEDFQKIGKKKLNIVPRFRIIIEKCVKKSTNKPMIGPVVLEITIGIFITSHFISI